MGNEQLSHHLCFGCRKRPLRYGIQFLIVQFLWLMWDVWRNLYGTCCLYTASSLVRSNVILRLFLFLDTMMLTFITLQVRRSTSEKSSSLYAFYHLPYVRDVYNLVGTRYHRHSQRFTQNTHWYRRDYQREICGIFNRAQFQSHHPDNDLFYRGLFQVFYSKGARIHLHFVTLSTSSGMLLSYGAHVPCGVTTRRS